VPPRHSQHLGSPLFASVDLAVRCQLDSIEIGALENVSPTENARWGTHPLQHVGSHLRSAVLSSGRLGSASAEQRLSGFQSHINPSPLAVSVHD
jgi:hypothetical protein